VLKKLRILTVTQHALMLAYRAEIYLWVLAHVMPFLMMGVWVTASRSGAGGAGGGGGMAFALTPVDYARYFVCVFIVRQFSTVWMIHEFEWHIVEGRLSYFLLRPMNPLWNYVTAHLGEQLARFPFFIMVLAFFFILYPQARWMPSASAILLGFFTIYVAFALRFALQYCFAMLTFWFERASAIEQLSFLPTYFCLVCWPRWRIFPNPPGASRSSRRFPTCSVSRRRFSWGRSPRPLRSSIRGLQSLPPGLPGCASWGSSCGGAACGVIPDRGRDLWGYFHAESCAS